MGEITTKYQPNGIEDKWYEHWIEKGYFSSKPDDRPSFTICIPPPNVTGVLHMGHILNNTIQDIMIRRARMMGYNACWVPGTDHASIATEAKVVKKLKEQGIDKREIGREAFLEHAFAWKEEYGGMILQQLKKLGCSCDWDRTRFTMEPKLSAAVIKVFVDLYNKDRMYRGNRMTNWDPAARTAVSDEEVYHKDSMSKLYHVKYQVEGSDQHVTIATTRPETILGDSAVCFHPEDARYTDLKGKKLIVPMIDRAVPAIFDDYVDMEFGTGALKVTPAHDVNDYELGKRHNLEMIDILDDTAHLNENAQLFVGKERFAARKLVVAELEKIGALVKVDEISNQVGYSERTDVVIEPRLTRQWFLKMQDLAAPALENVMNDNVQFVPAHQKNTYRHWMENVRDWCVSRQLWWGQRIPVYYLTDTEYVVAETPEAALELAREKFSRPELQASDLRQDEDVLDTWFSSWLWPISVFDGFEDDTELKYYYPGKAIVTAPDIMFFWVARMIMAGYEYMGEKPFDAVYFTGMVRDPKGRKMSKQLGNSPNPLDLIAKYGADATRVGMLMSSPAGGDLLFDIKLCEQGAKFSNKIWNACRLVKGWEVKEGKNEENQAAIDWFNNKFNKILQTQEKYYDQYRFSEILKLSYSFIWSDFCSDYLEMIKPEKDQPIDSATYEKTIEIFEKLLCMMHPMIPFITEEVYHLLTEREKGDCIINADYPKSADYDENLIAKGEVAKDIITQVRNARQQNKVGGVDPIKAYARVNDPSFYEAFLPIIQRMSTMSSLEFVTENVDNTVSFMVDKDEFFLDMGIKVDPEAEKARITEEIAYLKGFKGKVEKKLSNERFVSNAPAAVVEKEKQKMEDADQKIATLEEALAQLG